MLANLLQGGNFPQWAFTKDVKIFKLMHKVTHFLVLNNIFWAYKLLNREVLIRFFLFSCFFGSKDSNPLVDEIFLCNNELHILTLCWLLRKIFWLKISIKVTTWHERNCGTWADLIIISKSCDNYGCQLWYHWIS